MRRSSTWFSVILLAVACAATAGAQTPTHVISAVDDAKFGPAPPMLPRERSSRFSPAIPWARDPMPFASAFPRTTRSPRTLIRRTKTSWSPRDP